MLKLMKEKISMLKIYIENNGDIDTSLIIRELIYGDDELFSKEKLIFQQGD